MKQVTPKKIIAYLDGKRQLLKDRIKKLSILPRFGSAEDDNAMEVSEASVSQGLKNDLQKELAEVNSALEAAKSGQYGICKSCKGKIETARMKLIPSAIYCADCQSKIKSRRR